MFNVFDAEDCINSLFAVIPLCCINGEVFRDLASQVGFKSHVFPVPSWPNQVWALHFQHKYPILTACLVCSRKNKLRQLPWFVDAVESRKPGWLAHDHWTMISEMRLEIKRFWWIPPQLFRTSVTWPGYYKDTEQVLGKTFGMCALGKPSHPIKYHHGPMLFQNKLPRNLPILSQFNPPSSLLHPSSSSSSSS